MKEGFNTKVGAIAAAAGSAVGLGNMWRFPYVTGENGGAAFLIVYVAFTLLIAMPALLAEFAIGRMTGKPVTSALLELAPKKKWFLIGFMGVFCSFLIISFYSVVSGWILYYTWLSASGGLAGLGEAEVAEAFSRVSGSPAASVFWMVLMVAVIALIVSRGVAKGIEKWSKILMPVLLVLILVMCVRSLTLDGAAEGLKFLLSPDFSKLTPKALFAALGQSFFSLSTGIGVMATYGAYISRDQSLSADALSVAMLDFFIAFLAGVMIFPCAFAFGINPGSGPGLVFVTLPNIFNQMAFGSFFAFIFFLLLVVAALTSCFSMLEALVAFGVASLGLSRKRSTVIMTAFVLLGGTCCAVFPAVFNLFDNLSANVILPIGAFCIVLFVPLVIGKERYRAELEAHGGKFGSFEIVYFLTRFVVPLAIFLIFANSLLSWLGVDLFG